MTPLQDAELDKRALAYAAAVNPYSYMPHRQREALEALRREGPLTIGDLTRTLGEKGQVDVANRVGALVARGLVVVEDGKWRLA